MCWNARFTPMVAFNIELKSETVFDEQDKRIENEDIQEGEANESVRLEIQRDNQTMKPPTARHGGNSSRNWLDRG
jgi:hypothetical protein